MSGWSPPGSSGQPFDAIVVLGAAVGPDNVGGPALLRRVRHGAALYGAGMAGTLILTGGRRGGGEPEARVMAPHALAAGVPEACLLLEERAADTFDNARYTAELMRRRGLRRALVVTDGFHLRRALFAFRAFGIEALGSAPEPDRAWPLWRGLREGGALVWYALRCLPLRWKRDAGAPEGAPANR
jgi:uncharacterized SAM-binding protein YcdF (DUF218 family)